MASGTRGDCSRASSDAARTRAVALAVDGPVHGLDDLGILGAEAGRLAGRPRARRVASAVLGGPAELHPQAHVRRSSASATRYSPSAAVQRPRRAWMRAFGDVRLRRATLRW